MQHVSNNSVHVVSDACTALVKCRWVLVGREVPPANLGHLEVQLIDPCSR